MNGSDRLSVYWTPHALAYYRGRMLNCILLLAIAGPVDVTKTIQDVQTTYGKAGNIHARFEHGYFEQLRGRTKTEFGELWATPEGRIRWKYTKPERKDFVFDGKTAYFYEPQKAQVTVYESFDQSPLASAVRMLVGQGDLLGTFNVAPCSGKCDPGEPGDIVALLTPKKPLANIDHALLAIDATSRRVRAVVIIDALKNRTTYRFNDVTFQATVDAAKFAFTIPAGVQEIRAGDGGLKGNQSAAPKAP